jgi:4-hydroxy-tetrahydrodipicolinate synthase
MVTPFHQDGSLDLAGAGRLAQKLLDQGSDALVISGTTGESPTLGHQEKLDLFKHVRQIVQDRGKFIAGTGSYSTAETIELSQEADALGADALLVVTPFYNRPSQEGLYQHYKAVAESVSCPIILYNVPVRTGINLNAATTLRLAQIPNIVAIKDAAKDLEQAADVIAGAPPHFQVYSGDDALTLPLLSLGAVGVVSVTSHVIGLDLQKMHQAFFSGDLATARRLALAGIPITRALFSAPNPVAVKAAAQLVGNIESRTVRQPHVEATMSEVEAVRRALSEYGLKLQ